MSIPLAFNPLELVDLTRVVADEVGAGKYPFVRFDSEQRWHQRLYRDRRVDIWLISWLPTQGTALHDHGGSSGAFTVLQGELTEMIAEYRPSEASEPLTELVRGTGESVGFGSHYIHDVRNAGTVPAVSVHAYSSPLTSMNYYEFEDGRLHTIASVPTDDPERELRPSDLHASGLAVAS